MCLCLFYGSSKKSLKKRFQANKKESKGGDIPEEEEMEGKNKTIVELKKSLEIMKSRMNLA